MTYNKTINILFGRCTDLRQKFTLIERQAETVQEISMNASVTAGQAGSHAKTCTEIANQLAITIRRMRGRVDLIKSEINQITNIVLMMLTQSMRLQKYREALPDLKGAENRAVLSNIIEIYISRIADLAAEQRLHVYKTTAILRSFSQCHRRLFVTLSAFEIEAVHLEESEAHAILTLSEDLGKIMDEGVNQFEQSLKILSDIKKLASAVQEIAEKEMFRAKIRAA